MPSKRNRQRYQNRRIENTNNPATTSTAEATPAPAPAPTYTRSGKQAADTQIYTSFGKDLKWIGLVTAIVIILLIVAYYVVPH